MARSEALYSIVASTDTLDHLEVGQTRSQKRMDVRRMISRHRLITIALAGICLFWFGVVVGGAATMAWTIRNGSASNYMAKVEQRSPLIPDVTLAFHEQQFNGSLLKENIYRQNASEEVDEAWQALGIDCRTAQASSMVASPLTDAQIGA
jgi:hypothetical protein